MGQREGKQSAASAVVVTFNPPPAVLDNLALLAEQISEIVIVDNTEQTGGSDLLGRLEGKPGFTLIRNGKNLGIARALNIGIQRSIEKGYPWVATFDQDSSITPQFFSSLLAAYESCPYRSRVALVAPVLCSSEGEAAEFKNGTTGPLLNETLTAMTSGSLIRSEVFQREGPYDEMFFMDYVDYDYCLRLNKRGWKIIRASKAHLVHRLGAAETHRFLGFPVTIKSHTPWRRYLIMRNRVVIYRRYTLSFPLWCLHDFVWIFLEMTKIIFFEREKRAKFGQILRGMMAGFRGKMGQPDKQNT